MTLRAFLDQREQGEYTDGDAGDEHRGQPLDLAEQGNLAIERQEFK